MALIDLTGQTFEHLTVLGRSLVKSNNGSVMWECKCTCGAIRIVNSWSLRNGETKSCGKCIYKVNKFGHRISNSKNKFIVHEDYVEVYDSNNQMFVIDLNDLALAQQYTWRVNSKGYAESRGSIMLHRLILNAEPNQQVDHIDRNPANNRRSNLRLCTLQQNLFNRDKLKTNTSGYKGVLKYRDKWYAQIQKDRKIYRSENFSSKHDAARAYNKMALEYFGEFAYLNIVKESD